MPEKPDTSIFNQNKIRRCFFMIAAMIFSGSGPIVILSTYASLDDERFVKKLATKGINKFMAFELPSEKCVTKYGNLFNVVVSDLEGVENDFRVLDYNGNSALNRFSFKEMGKPVFYE
jgi:hypothetical protein